MSSIMRARNGLTGRSEVSEVIGLSPELKVAGPSMLGIGCPDRHALPRVNLVEICRARRVLPSRASGFVLRLRVGGRRKAEGDEAAQQLVRLERLGDDLARAQGVRHLEKIDVADS